MALKEFTGAISGDMTVNGNYSPSGVPAGNDTLKFASGTRTITVGLPAVNLDEIVIGKGWTGAFGTSASPIQLNVDRLRFASGASATGTSGCWLTLVTGTGEVWVEGGESGDNMLTLAGTVSACHAFGGLGRLSFANAMALAALKISHQNANVVVGSSITGLATLNANGGTLSLASSVTNLRLLGPIAATMSGGTPTNILLTGGARLNYNSSGGPTTLELHGQNTRFDATANVNVGPITIAGAEVFTGSIIDLRNTLDNINITLAKLLGGQILTNDGVII